MITSLVYFAIYLIVIGLVILATDYLVDAIPLPEPFYRVARIATLVISVLTVISAALTIRRRDRYQPAPTGQIDW